MSEPESVTGSCLCGAVRFSARLPSLFCAHCHCSMCRRSHGAGYVTWFAVPRARLRLDAGDDVEVLLFPDQPFPGRGAKESGGTTGD